ncbi:hypothetical protein BU15DRAFT_66339 [Melanogaster broomeanus]|nr:hypothetical protein BU15DRAFT_66339 [Melanogaster broomeanus]
MYSAPDPDTSSCFPATDDVGRRELEQPDELACDSPYSEKRPELQNTWEGLLLDEIVYGSGHQITLLRSFHEKTVIPGWEFHRKWPTVVANEKDRQLLTESPNVVEDLNLLKLPEYTHHLDICDEMEVGMADHTHTAVTTGLVYLETVAEYDLYCHYVIGLVGEGLTHVKERWFFWPKWIWAKYDFEEMNDSYDEKADVYTKRNVSIYMAAAALAVFDDSEIFQRSIKIRKTEAVRLVLRSTDPPEVALIF